MGDGLLHMVVHAPTTPTTPIAPTNTTTNNHDNDSKSPFRRPIRSPNKRSLLNLIRDMKEPLT